VGDLGGTISFDNSSNNNTTNRNYAASSDSSESSNTNECFGTPGYMSPELENSQEYSYNTDCWSTGCVLYELVTFDKLSSKYNKTDLTQTQINSLINNLTSVDVFKFLLKK